MRWTASRVFIAPVIKSMHMSAAFWIPRNTSAVYKIPFTYPLRCSFYIFWLGSCLTNRYHSYCIIFEDKQFIFWKFVGDAAFFFGEYISNLKIQPGSWHFQIAVDTSNHANAWRRKSWGAPYVTFLLQVLQSQWFSRDTQDVDKMMTMCSL